jgi:hypothetical protein
LISRALPFVMACLAIAVLAPSASATASSRPSPSSARTGSRSGTNASVACKRLHAGHVRCTMTIKGGAGISGTVRMRLARGTLLVALGQGEVTRGKATLTMRVLHPMTPGRYTVKMVLTVNVTRVLRVR